MANWGGFVLATATVAVKADETPTDTRTSRKHRRLPIWWFVVTILLVAVIVVTFTPGVLDYFNDPDAEVHAPGITDFLPDAIFGEGTWFEFNRLTLARVIAAAALIVVLSIAAVTAKLRPSGFQVCVEYVLEFVRRSIGVATLGEARGRRYAKTLGFVFFGVLAMNLTGIIPGLNIGASSAVAVPVVCAVYVWVVYIAAGIKERGFKRFTKEQLVPAGVPASLCILITPIEFFSTFIMRPVSLIIRLLANMMAGHMLLAVTYFGTQALMLAGGLLAATSVLTFAGSVVVTLFELFVAILQAYIFTMLAAVYIKLSVEAH